MTPPPIKFGTDGWRGVIADDFTFANVRIAAAAITNYILHNEDPTKSICVGYDTRFASPAFARTVAEVAADVFLEQHERKTRPTWKSLTRKHRTPRGTR